MRVPGVWADSVPGGLPRGRSAPPQGPTRRMAAGGDTHPPWGHRDAHPCSLVASHPSVRPRSIPTHGRRHVLTGAAAPLPPPASLGHPTAAWTAGLQLWASPGVRRAHAEELPGMHTGGRVRENLAGPGCCGATRNRGQVLEPEVAWALALAPTLATRSGALSAGQGDSVTPVASISPLPQANGTGSEKATPPGTQGTHRDGKLVPKSRNWAWLPASATPRVSLLPALSRRLAQLRVLPQEVTDPLQRTPLRPALRARAH